MLLELTEKFALGTSKLPLLKVLSCKWSVAGKAEQAKGDAKKATS